MEAKEKGICAVQFIFNPKSFTQTIENIFHFLFLTKKGDASVKVKDSKPSVNTKLDLNNVTPRQAIVSLNMRQWREMCR